MRRALIGVTAFLATLVMASSALAVITPTLVEGGGGDQIRGAANTGWVMWSTNTATSDTDHYDTFARSIGGDAFKVNASGTGGLSGGLNGNTSQAIYQQTDALVSNLYMYDLATKIRTNPPAGINTSLWEWSPSISPGYILFGRNSFKNPSAPWKVMLYNRTTGTTTILATAQNKCECIFPGQVTDTYATWTKCTSTLCQAWYHNIGTGVSAKIPNPLAKQTYYPAVAASSNNMYFARSGTGCGVSTKIYRWNPATPGTTTLVTSLASGHDLSTSSLANRDGTHDDVYIAELVCSGQYNADINVIADGDTAFAGPVQERVGGSSAAKRLLPPGATPS